jgi:16S rRNA C967 or C1407 C5-methylase (RsmB/RsmF family)/NOL1/NOP2/fmu family ribosome biogenesis protein
MVELPSKLLQSLTNIEGFDIDSFISAHQLSTPVSIRFNHVKLKDLELSSLELPLSTQVPWCLGGYYLTERPSFTLDPALHAGAYYVQEASSMFLHYILSTVHAEDSELKVLDLCAAPGGKTTVLASLPQFKLVLANELIKSRVNILYENIVKWGTPHVLISNNDPSDFTPIKDYFDTIIVDAPCSGSGLFRKDNKAIEEWSENNVKLCAERQKRILADVLPSLKEGGILVYSTCSYSREENEDIVDWLMQHAVFEPIAVNLNDSWNIVETHSEKGGIGYRFFPGKTNGEGFFIACFRLIQTQASTWIPEKKLVVASASEIALIKEWINQDFFTLIKKNESLMVLPEEIALEVQLLQQFLYLRKSGVLAGTVIRNQFIPEHELILSNYCNNNLPFFEVNKIEALQYLKKAELNIGDFNKGWYVIKYNNLKLGLIKHLGNRINNYYPASWRILKS